MVERWGWAEIEIGVPAASGEDHLVRFAAQFAKVLDRVLLPVEVARVSQESVTSLGVRAEA